MEKIKKELVVIGAGPAGLAAAIESSKLGVDTLIIDENNVAGGQLFKQIHRFFGSKEHYAGIRGFNIGEMLCSEAEELGIEILLEHVVWGISPDFVIGVSNRDKVILIEAEKIIVATGAVENSLAFPGCTLPNIMGAGAAQTMVNVNRVLPGDRVVIVGSGNVGLIVAYQLMQSGAKVLSIVEALGDINGYQVHASKVKRMGIPILVSHTITEAMGDKYVERAKIAKVDSSFKTIDGTEMEIDLDMICIAVGLRPLTEICGMIGVQFIHIPELGGFIPIHNENMETTVQGVFIAGDVSGIEEASTAIEEGRIAGIAAGMALGKKVKNNKQKMLSDAIQRADLLRTGPYGDVRRIAKERIVDMYYKN